MIGLARKAVRRIFKTGPQPTEVFLSYHYLRHNQRRQEHLASLGLEIAASTVLEVGAGIGDHTSYFLDRGCQVTSTDGRLKNIEVLRGRYADLEVLHLDLDHPQDVIMSGSFDIVYCYGLLYHLSKPSEAIEFLARRCRNMLLLETVVSRASGESVDFCKERIENPTQSASGLGCCPSREWVFNQLKRHFEFVYMPITQPNHEEFPLDWTSASPDTGLLTRAVYVASRQPIANDLLIEEVPARQRRAP